MKTMLLKKVMIALFGIVLMAACDNDDGPNLSRAERALVGCWQVVEYHNIYLQEPVNGIQVLVFKPDRTESFYQDGQLIYETQFWAKPEKDYDGYYLYHSPNDDYSKSTYSCSFKIDGNQLTIYESGCFNVSQTVYRRIPSLDEADPEVVAYHYEDHPTTLEGVWHLTKAFYSFGGSKEFPAGDVTVYFNPNQTIHVAYKAETKETMPFLDSGSYSYKIIKTETDEHDGTTHTTIDINGRQCTYWFKDDMMTLDFGMAYDAPGYFFKKLKFNDQ